MRKLLDKGKSEQQVSSGTMRASRSFSGKKKKIPQHTKLFPLPVQQTADQLLARADAAKALAEEAAKKGQATFREAQDILDNLRGTRASAIHWFLSVMCYWSIQNKIINKKNCKTVHRDFELTLTTKEPLEGANSL